MNARQNELLKLIIETHIHTGEPIGSQFLVETAGLDMSGATVRNEMRELEEGGYLTHPHTSAGRVPTETGYRYYVNRIMAAEPLPDLSQHELRSVTSREEGNLALAKSIARFASDYMANAVIVAFGGKNVYYTGISMLFSQPEFSDMAETVRVSQVFDHCEERMDDLYGAVESKETHVLVGSENPLGNACGLIAGRLNKDDVFAILGPMRMDYKKGVGLLNYIQTAM